MQSILDAAVMYVDSIFQHMLLWKIIDIMNIILVEIPSIILRTLLQLTMKKLNQMRIVVVAEVEVEAEAEVEAPKEIQKIIKRKVDTDANTEQDAIEF